MPNPGAGCVTGAHGVIVPVTSNLKSCAPRGAGVGWLRCPSVRGTSPGQCIQDFGPGVCGADGLGEGDPDGDPDADGDGLGAIVGGAIRAFAAAVPTRWRRCGRWRAARRSPVRAG